MKSLLFTGSLLAILTLAGCSGSKPVVDDSGSSAGSQAEEVNIIDEGGVAGSESGITSSSDEASRSMTLESLEAELTPIYFEFDQYKLVQDDIDTLQKNVQIVNGDTEAVTGANQFSLKLEGNCDEWGSDEYNFALGLKRAVAVKDELMNNGIEAGRITMVSYGSSSPVCMEKTQECWSKNRRVDFKLLP
ncbi:MAG: OmpA family protein [Thiovulaceae bacterium]|nr:OmpA family protein [Sulfurimonadaceae bacterium]